MLNVSNLPRNVPLPQVRQRVEQIMENCGGRLVQYLTGGNGLIKFPTPESAQRYPIHSNMKMKNENE
jgi:Limkain b1